jgi:hypothetical protein
MGIEACDVMMFYSAKSRVGNAKCLSHINHKQKGTIVNGF